MVIKYHDKAHSDDWDISTNCTQFVWFFAWKRVIFRWIIFSVMPWFDTFSMHF